MIRWTTVFLLSVWVKLFYRHKTYGKEHLPPDGGIIAPNHCSYLDPPLLAVSFPGVIHFLGRDSLFRSRFWAWYLNHLSTHPIVRGRENVGAFRLACSLIQSGKKLVIFPEGTRSRDGELKKGESGVGFLMMRTGCLVIPVYIHGSFSILNASRRFPKLRGRTACVIGSPIDFKDVEGATKKEKQRKIADEIMRAIANLRDWYLNGAQGSPP